MCSMVTSAADKFPQNQTIHLENPNTFGRVTFYY